MAIDRDAQDARQGEFGRRTFVVLIASTTIAALLAIGAYFYVFAEDDRQLDGPMPSTGSIQGTAETPPAPDAQ
ncbi:hypothetical protein [Acuticoccus sp. I52.16.1]|uniref:hypothetical protein n=1 Tax=Acuticoccus sp. I52.16.1 TaxID=2928472 RepID=UPI001FD48709|nr:hypothetical protein [Acuticoccus sp. I52.16.1]UOM34561.1 hypothetical protein MRB58_22565 [Acuticoccus sp. I52.16.1]